ncbi:hypothetical protein [Desulfopila aestuarii]|uniref:Uncharacterized protein n=1 Tax=Desulfopila aestuarii DSM 18488 TaxID=1121416 RepID=A0A1M7Y5L0_9BACT|nr:hypothetical protein [Desulfopila aestuarii]SHO47836.1 hypothetical protein SAMN02745220_01987 [Desulfopila aestuarii DSM 18488]
MEPKQVSGKHPDMAVEQWQRRMIPLMRGGLVTLVLFFFLVSLVQYHLLYQDLRSGSPIEPDRLEQLENTLPESQRSQLGYVQWKTLVSLEQDVIRMRYQQINATLLLRTWTRQTGFLVGMVLAMVGAFFILGRLKEESSQLSGESGGFKVMLTSSSPGIILATLGTILMVVTLTVKFDYQIQDRPVYLALYALGSSKTGVLDLPGSVPESSTALPHPGSPTSDMLDAAPIGQNDMPISPFEKGSKK